jgi:hypothetical protein
MAQLSKTEKKIIAALLRLASDDFANHGCNDFDLTKIIPNSKERRELIQRYYLYNGDPSEFRLDDEEELSDYFDISVLINYLANKLEEK